MANFIQRLSTQQQALLGAAFAILAAIGFSAKAIMVKLAYVEPIDALTLLTLRMAFSAPIFVCIALWSGQQAHRTRLTRKDWLAVLVLGLIGYYLSSLLDFTGLQYVSAGLDESLRQRCFRTERRFRDVVVAEDREPGARLRPG